MPPSAQPAVIVILKYFAWTARRISSVCFATLLTLLTSACNPTSPTPAEPDFRNSAERDSAFEQIESKIKVGTHINQYEDGFDLIVENESDYCIKTIVVIINITSDNHNNDRQQAIIFENLERSNIDWKPVQINYDDDIYMTDGSIGAQVKSFKVTDAGWLCDPNDE